MTRRGSVGGLLQRAIEGDSGESAAALEAVRAELQSLRHSLQSEFGRVSCEVVAHNPEVLPFVKTYQLEANALEEIDLEKSLGKPSTRGHVKNLGEEPAYLRFRSPSSGAWSEVYELASLDALDVSSMVLTHLELSTNAATRLLVFAQ